MTDESDLAATPEREAIKTLYRRLGIVPSRTESDFGCKWCKECSQRASTLGKPFRTGGWPYVGVEYGRAKVRGVEARILLVAMDIGGNERSDAETFEDAQWRWRRYAEERYAENPHMRGVHLIMKRIAANERDDEARARQFALTNAVKCVTETDNKKSTATGKMQKNCKNHLGEEISVLKPDLIVTQGGYPAWATGTLLTPLTPVPEGKFCGEPRGRAQPKALVWISASTVLLTTPHPARLKGFSWERRQLPDFFQKAIDKACDELVKILRSGS